VQTQLVDVDGRATAVVSAGSGEPLVFFHGGGIVEGFDCFAPLAEHLRFLAPQMPGFGGTALDPPVTDIDGMVRHTLRLLDALGVGEFALAGHSLGGWLAASLAAAHPERVRTLVLAATFGLEVPDHPIANVPAMAPDDVYKALTNDPTIFDGRVPTAPDPEFEAARALEGRSLQRFHPGAFDPTIAPKLARISMPTLLLWGEDDRIVPVEHLPAWQRSLPAAQTRVYPGVGHLLFHEHRPAVDVIAEVAAR
jgi:pimeloyl-ACP methyl ester carboxylesterase